MNGQVLEVVVDGRFGPDLTAALSEFDVEPVGGGRTRIVGRIPDQAKLFGLLELLDELHIEVISVNRLPPEEISSLRGDA